MGKEIIGAINIDSKVAAWIEYMGLRFNPFEFVVAEQEDQLLEYVVAPNDTVLPSLTGEQHTLVFAEPGGGKSTLWRLGVSHCRKQMNHDRHTQLMVNKWETEGFFLLHIKYLYRLQQI